MNLVACFLQIVTILGLVGYNSYKNEQKLFENKLCSHLDLENSYPNYLGINNLNMTNSIIQDNENFIPRQFLFTVLYKDQKKYVKVDKLESTKIDIKSINNENILDNSRQLYQSICKISNSSVSASATVESPSHKQSLGSLALYFTQKLNKSLFLSIPGSKLIKDIQVNTFISPGLSVLTSIITSISAIYCIRWLTKYILALITKTKYLADTSDNNLLKLDNQKENKTFNVCLKLLNTEKCEEINQVNFINNFELIGMGLCLFSLEGNILAINPLACQMLGYSSSELLNLSLNDITYPEDQALDVNFKQQLLIKEINYYQVEKRFIHKNGQVVWVYFSASLGYDEQNQSVYFIAQLQSITQHKLAENALKESEASLRSFYDSSPMMMGIVEITEDDIIHLADNLATANFFGTTVEAMKNKKASEMGTSKAIIHEWLGYYRESAAKKSPVRFEYIHQYEAGTKWFSVTVSPILSSNENYSKFSYVVVDITEHKQIQENLERVNAQLSNWVRELEERNREIILLGKMSKVLQTCSSVEEAHHVIADLLPPLFPEFCGAFFIINSEDSSIEFVTNWGDEKFKQQLYSTNDCLLMRCEICHLLKSNTRKLEQNQVIQCPWDGEIFCIPIEAQGKVIGILHLYSHQTGKFTLAKQQLAVTLAENISLTLANLKLYEELQQQSIRDPLTGLYNRRYLEQFLEREIQRAVRSCLSLAVIMLDVDHFKQFNDQFGHEAGDIVLRELGKLLQKEFRGSDVVCRYGGEEFTIILPEISKQDAFNRAENVRKAVKNLKIQHRSNRLNAITISLGVACFPEDGLMENVLMQAADEALYAAKQSGRDRVVTAAQLASKYSNCSHSFSLD